METRWRIALLGELRATQGERVVRRFRTQQTGALLAYLAYYPERSHPRELLIDLLWPEPDPTAGRHKLSVALSSLRHQLEPPGAPAGTVLVADRTSLQLNAAAVTVDVAEFLTALKAAESARSRGERGELLARAVELYNGELLPGYYDDWILQEREWLAERYFQASSQLLGYLEELGDRHRALEVARRAVRADSLREEAHRDLIRLLVAAGQPEAALRQYAELERLLEQELAATPSAATRALVASLDKGAAATSRAGVRSSSPQSITTEVLPRGTVTFLLTDIEGSTARWEPGTQPTGARGGGGEAFRSALSSHHALLRRLFRQHGGYEVKEIGDAFLVAFQRTGDALACAVAGQRALRAHPWPDGIGEVRVRMTLHTGDVEPQDGDYHGLVLHHAQRVLVTGHGGQILCSEATAGLVRHDLEPGLRLIDLGVYRLRDVATPQRLFQVEYPEMPWREFPPLRAEAGHAGHLPLQFTRFFGREGEIARLGKLLLSLEQRLVTLMGPGGSGKTRLAVEAVRPLVEAWRGAVWFVPLADLAAYPSLRLAEAVRDALRLPRAADVEALEQVVTALSQQPSLLVLDNFEHLVSQGAEWVQRLLERVPTLTCLVTSRQRLNLPGERQFVVRPLPVPDWELTSPPLPPSPKRGGGRGVASEAPNTERLLSCPSVQLFVDRAQAVCPDYQVTAGNAEAVAALCDRLEGIPLAIELAAARAQVLSPAQMLARLEQRFELLVSRQRGTPSRHRSLRAALDGSYELLSPELQRFFAQLSVFRGGWGLEAAETVCDEPLALDYLAQLRECSLVDVETGDDEVRYRLLETLREYAEEQLATEERAALAQRHATYYLALAEQAEPELVRPQQKTWLARLEHEHDNLRAALRWALAERETLTALRLAAALHWFWIVHNHVSEGREWLSQALHSGSSAADGNAVSSSPSLSAPDVRERAAARAKALYCAARLALTQGDVTAARAPVEESVALWQALGDPHGLAYALAQQGWLAGYLGDRVAARASHEQSVALLRKLTDPWGLAWALLRLGEVAHRLEGDLATARPLYEESLALFRAVGDQWHLAWCVGELGGVAWWQGEVTTACMAFEEALALQRALGDKRAISVWLRHLGDVARHQGDLRRASVLYEESLATVREAGLRQEVMSSLHCLGRAAYREGEVVRAAALLGEALVLACEQGWKDRVARCLAGFALVAGAQGRPERAARLLGAAAALNQSLGAPPEPADRAEEERAEADARAALGDDAFAAAWNQGRGLTLEQVVAEALAVR